MESVEKEARRHQGEVRAEELEMPECHFLSSKKMPERAKENFDSLEKSNERVY